MFCEKVALFVKKVFLIFHFKSKYFKEQTTILPNLQANHSIKFTLWNNTPLYVFSKIKFYDPFYERDKISVQFTLSILVNITLFGDIEGLVGEVEAYHATKTKNNLL